MYWNVPSHVRVNGIFSDYFLVQVGSHQDLVLSLLSIAIVLEALSREIRFWLHKRCSGFKGKLKDDSKFEYQLSANQQTYIPDDCPDIVENFAILVTR